MFFSISDWKGPRCTLWFALYLPTKDYAAAYCQIRGKHIKYIRRAYLFITIVESMHLHYGRSMCMYVIVIMKVVLLNGMTC